MILLIKWVFSNNFLIYNNSILIIIITMTIIIMAMMIMMLLTLTLFMIMPLLTLLLMIIIFTMKWWKIDHQSHSGPSAKCPRTSSAVASWNTICDNVGCSNNSVDGKGGSHRGLICRPRNPRCKRNTTSQNTKRNINVRRKSSPKNWTYDESRIIYKLHKTKTKNKKKEYMKFEILSTLLLFYLCILVQFH